MPKRKRTSKRRPRKRSFKRRKSRANKVLINRGVNPIANSYITTVEYNDVFHCPAGFASYYNIYSSNGPYAPFIATNMSGVNNDSPYGWANMMALYGRYSVLSSTIMVECINETANPFVLSLMEMPNSGAMTDQENILGNPNGKNVVVANYTNKGKLSMTTQPYKRLGLDRKDDTYRALTTANPSVQRYYQISAHSIDTSAPVDAAFRLVIRYRCLFSDRTNLVQ